MSGTYAALTQHPRGTISMRMREIGSGPAVQLTLTTYSASGAVLASGHVTGTSASWTTLQAVQEAGKDEPVSYFSLASSSTANHIQVDEIEFETPSTTPPVETTTTPAPTPPAPPTAVLSLQTPNPTGGQSLTLTGAGSQPGAGQIISYDWDLKGDGKFQASTGSNPVVQLILAPGVHTVGLKVTNSEGQSSTTTSKFSVLQPAERPDHKARRRGRRMQARRSNSGALTSSANASRQ